MDQAWDTLMAFGLPDGPPRPAPRTIDFARIREVLATIDVARVEATRRAILLGWLDAWRHHWPSRFERELGELGERLHASLRARPFDANRYLKLRRIAAENLAGVL